MSPLYDKVLETLLFKDTNITKGYVFEDEFDVFFSGTYSLLLTFEPNKSELQKIFGDFACWNTRKNIPCGTYKDYELSWVIKSDDGYEVNGKSTPFIRQGGSLGKTWNEGIGLPFLKPEHYTLEVTFITDLSELSHLKPKIKIHPRGAFGAKSLPSALMSYIELGYLFSVLICYPLIVIITLLILYKTITRPLRTDP